MEQWERGFYSVGEKHVCEDCVTDYAVCDFVREHVTATSCNYYGRYAAEEIATRVDDVIEFMLEGFETEWGDSIDVGNVFDKEEGKHPVGPKQALRGHIPPLAQP